MKRYIKDKELLRLKEVVDIQKVKYGIRNPKTGKDNPTFSFFFDARTRKLGYRFREPRYDASKGKYVGHPRVKFFGYIHDKNWKKYFKGSTSIVPDVAKNVTQQIENAIQKYDNYQDEFDFGWWKERFYNRKRIGKDFSPETLKQNRRIVEPFYFWCLEEHPISDEIGQHPDRAVEWVSEYLIYRGQGDETRKPKPYQPWSSATQKTCLRNLKSFYSFIAKTTRGKFPYDILKPVEVAPTETTREGINSTEFDKIVDFIRKKKDDAYWNKFIMMLRLQIRTGMRVGELVSIRNDRIDESEKVIVVEGKTGKRSLPFNHADDEIMWNDILDKKVDGADYLFYQTRVQFYPRQKHKVEIDLDLKTPTTTSYYQQRFRQMRDLLGLRGKGIISSHSIRRFYITEFVKRTDNIELCRQVIGHTTTRMTSDYVDSLVDKETRITPPLPSGV